MAGDSRSRGISLIHPQIRSLNAYRVVPFDGTVKLDAMESPYGFEESLHAKWLEHIATAQVNRYPDPSAKILKQKMRDVFKIPKHLGLTLGNGSDELLQLIQMAVGGYGRCIMAPQPTFTMYEIIAQYTRASFVGVDLDENFQLQEDSWLDTVKQNQPACIFLSYPNNPTGNFFSPDLIENTARVAEGLVIVDEAYHAYSGKSMMSAMEKFENMAVVRTLSKSGFAGLRVGYLVSHPTWAAEFEKIRFPYNVGVLAQESAAFALDHWEDVCIGTERVLEQRSYVTSNLERANNLIVYPTQTNFVTFRVRNQSSTNIFESLQKEGILIKNLHGSHPLLSNCLRLTIGTADENEKMLSALIKQI